MKFSRVVDGLEERIFTAVDIEGFTKLFIDVRLWVILRILEYERHLFH